MSTQDAVTPPPAPAGGDTDALLAVLAESRDKNRGVTIYANGTAIPVVVVAFDGPFVIAKNRESGKIVIRLDRIDGVASQFQPRGGRPQKTPDAIQIKVACYGSWNSGAFANGSAAVSRGRIVKVK